MSIISAILFLVLVSSGSVFCSSYFNKRYEEILPITCVAMVAISFILGIIGLLKYSTLTICILGLVLFVLGIIKAVKDKQIKSLLANTFTPGFFVFIVLAVIMLVGVYGKLFDTNDEFSHWGDIVKVMTLIDDFGTNPASHSTFKTYPPGMSLFQYLAVEINVLVTKESFSEWLCYYAYDIFAIAMLMPICNKMSFRKILSPICVILIIFLIPMGFYTNVYSSVYIDAFLGFLIASGLIAMLWSEKIDLWFILTMCSVMFMLTLSKDAGLLFAVFFAIGTTTICVLKSKDKVLNKPNISYFLASSLSILIPKLLWKLNININHANPIFKNKISLISLINVIIGKEQSYRREVLKNYINEFITGVKFVGNSEIAVNYTFLVAFSLFVAYFVIRIVEKTKIENSINGIVCFICLFFITIAYTVGLCIIYMYSFSELEAVGLASFARYLFIIFVGMWLFNILCLIKYADSSSSNRNIICGFIICFVIFAVDLKDVYIFLTNAYAKASVAVRETYMDVVNKTLEYADGDDQIWFIQQETYGEDGQQYNFCIRQNYVGGYPSIGQFEDEDDQEITLPKTPEEWRKELVDENYDFVMLYDVNGTFRSYFASCFENPDRIEDRTLWKVNKETGMLSLCE